jgi:hypothetical protein
LDDLIKEEEEELRRENLLGSDEDDYDEEAEGEEEEEEDEEYWDDEAEEDDELYSEEEYEEEEVVMEEEVKEKSRAKHNKKVSFADQSSKAQEIRSPADIYAHMLKKAKQSEQSTDDTHVEKITPEDIDFISPLNKPEEKKRSTSLFKSGRRSNLLYTPQETRKPTSSTVPIGGVKENFSTKNSQQITNSPVKSAVVEKEVRPEDVDVEALEDEIWMKEVIEIYDLKCIFS